MKLAVFGEHVGMLRSLGVTLEQVMMRMVLLFFSHVKMPFEVILKLLSVSSSEALHAYGALHVSP